MPFSNITYFTDLPFPLYPSAPSPVFAFMFPVFSYPPHPSSLVCPPSHGPLSSFMAYAQVHTHKCTYINVKFLDLCMRENRGGLFF